MIKKKITVLKALSMMDEKEVEDFLDNDCRYLDEIIDSVQDESERKYVNFISKLFEICDKLEAETHMINLDKPTYILSSTKNMNSPFDNVAMPSFPPQNIFDNLIKPIDYSKFTVRRD